MFYINMFLHTMNMIEVLWFPKIPGSAVVVTGSLAAASTPASAAATPCSAMWTTIAETMQSTALSEIRNERRRCVEDAFRHCANAWDRVFVGVIVKRVVLDVEPLNFQWLSIVFDGIASLTKMLIRHCCRLCGFLVCLKKQ